MSYQKIIIEGRVGRDPETRYTPSGDAVCNFSVAVGEKRGGEEETTWFRVTAWKKTAEIASQYVKKGGNVLVEGRIRTREWNDQSGNKREAWELVCDRLVLLGGRQQEASPPVQQHAREKANAYAADYDSEVPF